MAIKYTDKKTLFTVKTGAESVEEWGEKSIPSAEYVRKFAEYWKENNKELFELCEPHFVMYLKEVAVSLEEVNISAAIEYMLIASTIRPNGPFIKNKLKQYRSNEEAQLKEML